MTTPPHMSQLYLNKDAVLGLIDSTSYETKEAPEGLVEGVFLKKGQWQLVVDWVRQAAKRETDAKANENPNTLEEARKDIADLKDSVAQLCKAIQNPTLPIGPKSWASVAAYRPQTVAQTDTRHAPTELTAEAKALQEVVVHIPEELERERLVVGNRSSIFHKIQSALPQAGVVGLCRLRSGDWKVQTVGRAGAELLRRNKSWLSSFASSAALAQPRFPVLVHGVSKTEVLGSKEDIETILKDNERYHRLKDFCGQVAEKFRHKKGKNK